MNREPRFSVQFSLRLVLAALTGCGVFLALVEMSDLPSAVMFLICVGGLLLPVLVTFGALYLELKGISLSRRRRGRAERERSPPKQRTE